MAYNNRPTSMDELMSVPRDQKAEMVRSWIDDIPLSRHKKHVGRDLADAGTYMYMYMMVHVAMGHDMQPCRCTCPTQM